MLLYPFPPRGDIPPPVPPKATVPLAPINCQVINAQTKTVEACRHKTNMLSVHKSDSVSELRPARANSSNPSSPTETPPRRLTKSPPTSQDTARRISSMSTPHPSSRLETAKQKARGVWNSRRKNSNASLQPVKITAVTAPRLDSLSTTSHGKHSNICGWRSNFFGEPVKTNHDNTLSIQCKGPMSAQELVRLPDTIWSSFDNNHHPIMPAKAAAVLHTPPPFLRPRRATVGRDDSEVKRRDDPEAKESVAKVQRDEVKECAESGLLEREEVTSESRFPADMTVAPLQIRKTNRHVRHKRKNSSISTVFPQHRVRRSDSTTTLHPTEIASLQRKAMKQTEKFNVLSLNEVEALSRELFDLDNRCENLRQTRTSLRQGRKTLHTRMITYLRKTRPGAFSQDNLLTQEEALAELDTALEEWEIKLEKAEKRRAEIKERLLEHVAAAALRVVKNIPRIDDDRDATPPATPEKQRKWYEQESITVYALLADVKNEVERTTCII